jgi:hypothetical protein
MATLDLAQAGDTGTEKEENRRNDCLTARPTAVPGVPLNHAASEFGCRQGCDNSLCAFT